MKSYTIKCKRTGAIMTFELPELAIFQKQFNMINGWDKLFTDYYEFIDESSITLNTFNSNTTKEGSKPKQECLQREASYRVPSIKYSESADPPEILNLFNFIIFE